MSLFVMEEQDQDVVKEMYGDHSGSDWGTADHSVSIFSFS